MISFQFVSVSVLMKSIREDIDREHPAVRKSDVNIFFQVAEFVTSFQFYKYSASKVREISEICLSLQVPFQSDTLIISPDY